MDDSLPLLATPDEFATLTGESTPSELAMSVASSAVRSYCEWDITERDYSLLIDGSGEQRLTLPLKRLTSVTSVSIRGAEVTDYQWSAGGYLFRRGRWPDEYRAVGVECVAGYTDVPPIIKAVVINAATRVTTPYGLTQELASAGGVSVNSSFSGSTSGVELDMNEMNALAPFRIGLEP